MKKAVEVSFFDGVHANAVSAFILPKNDSSISLFVDAQNERHYMYQQMVFIGAVGNRKAIIELPDHARIEFLDKVPHWFGLKQKAIYHAIWQLERSPSLIFASLVLLCMLLFATLKWGIPWGAQQLALLLPQNTMQAVGNQTAANLLQDTKASALSKQHQQRLRDLYLRHIAQGHPAELIFRQGGKVGVNAAAIPNNSILVMDELIALAGTDEEVIAVLAHEQAHLLERHSLQKVIANLGAAGLWGLLTGDHRDIVASLSLMLADAHYSQEIEMDADDAAVQRLASEHISPIHLANFLQRVDNARVLSQQNQDSFNIDNLSIDFDGDSDHVSKSEAKAYALAKWLDKQLSSHPQLEQRIQRIHAFEQAKSQKQ